MGDRYKFETFRATADRFERDFSAYLDQRSSERWRVKVCSCCLGASDGKRYAACLFEREN